jgi:hypothetical protein
MVEEASVGWGCELEALLLLGLGCELEEALLGCMVEAS